MKIVVSHPTGNQNVRCVLSGFNKNDILAEFDTSLAINENAKWLNLLSGALKKEILRRQFSLRKSMIHSYPARELSRMMFSKLGWAGFTKHESGWASVDSVYRSFDKKVANRLHYLKNKQSVSAVYAYEDGALETFKQAKQIGLQCIYDLPIAYWKTIRALLLEEAQRMPEWKQTLGGGIADSERKLERKSEELALADVVVVPSEFVKTSLSSNGIKKPVILSPFGSPKHNTGAPVNTEKRPLRVLFAGSMGQRKGLGDLFHAMKLINTKHVELVVMGSPLADMSFYRNQFPYFRYEAGRPFNEVLELMKSCDVFCLPSIAEGRALVMQEAMSQGLPLIITPNTGGEDLIIEGETGFLIPIRSPELIAEKINWLANNRQVVTEMGRLAQLHSERYSWQLYGQHIVNELKTILH